MKRYGLYIVAGAISSINPDSDAPACAVAMCPTTTYTLFDGSEVIDEVTEPSIVENDDTVMMILAKYGLSTVEVDIVGGTSDY